MRQTDLKLTLELVYSYVSLPESVAASVLFFYDELIFPVNFVTGRNEVVAKVKFLHLFVILLTGGVVEVSHKALRQMPPPPDQAHHPPDQAHPPGPDTPPDHTHTPPDQTHPPPLPEQAHYPPPPREADSGMRSYERQVRILLECILVLSGFTLLCLAFFF